jgi:hypothetical protein
MVLNDQRTTTRTGAVSTRDKNIKEQRSSMQHCTSRWWTRTPGPGARYSKPLAVAGMVGAALVSSAWASPAHADVTLVQDGTARAAIYVEPEVMAADNNVSSQQNGPYQAELQRRNLRESVNDLSLYLGKISGATVPVVQGAPQAGDTRVPILIGDLAAKTFGPIVKHTPYKQDFRVVAGNKGVGLEGESDESTSYAIYEVLDRLGCRWVIPSDIGEVIPSMRTIKLPDGDATLAPGTYSRFIWYADEAFKRRTRMGGLNVSAGHALEVHSGDQYGYLTKKQLEEHPDWNAEINGKRSVNGRFCWGNPEVAAAVADSIIAQLDKNYTPTVSLSPDDGATFCECAKCKALDAGDWDPTMNQVSLTDRYVHFCNEIAERVTKKYPNVLFGFLAYVQYTRPPVREKLNPNLVPEIAPITYCRAHAMTDAICPSRQQIKYIVDGWGKVSKQISYYNYMFQLAEVAVPYPMMHQMSEELPVLYRNNVKFWQPETMPNFESVAPGMYLSMRLAWNPNQQPKAVLDEFFTRFYGNAAAPMRRYWQTIDDAWTNVPEHAGCGFGHDKRFTPAVMNAARAAMDDALKAAKTPAEIARVKMEDDSLRQFEHFMKMRGDYAAGRFANLGTEADNYVKTEISLGDQYAPQSAFTKVGWSPNTIGGGYFKAFYGATYDDAGRIARDYTIISPAVHNWRYQVDKEKQGDAKGWNKVDADDKAWKSTDTVVDTWFDLGLDAYYGPVWYRASIPVGATNGKKSYLWVGCEDGDIKVFVNGQHIPYVDKDGKKSTAFSGYCAPASFDITAALKPNAANQVTIVGTRTILNELGTGGLMSPVVIYQEK